MKRKEIKPYFKEIKVLLENAERVMTEGELEAALESLNEAFSYLGTTTTYIKNEIKYKERGYRHKSELTKFKEGDLVEFIKTEKVSGDGKCRYHKGDVGKVVGYVMRYGLDNRSVRVLLPGRKYAVNVNDDVLKIYSQEKEINT